MNRRHVLTAALGTFACGTSVSAADMPKVTIYRNPGCGCCERWAAHMREAGFAIEIVDDPDLAARRSAMGVPEALAACHTAEAGGYLIEGHVPSADVMALLGSRPASARGLAVPGMPIGSPGMESDAGTEPFETILFMHDGSTKTFARH